MQLYYKKLLQNYAHLRQGAQKDLMLFRSKFKRTLSTILRLSQTVYIPAWKPFAFQ